MISDSLFQEELVSLFNDRKKEALPKLRQQAWDRFINKGLPSKSTESYQYLKLRNLYGRTLKSPEVKSLAKSFDATPYLYEDSYALVFCEGKYDKEKSRLPDIDILPFKEAIQAYSTLLNNLWTKRVTDENDSFALINGALHEDGVFVYIPPKLKLNKPLEILFYSESEQALNLPKVLIFCGASSEANIVSRHIQKGNTLVVSSVDFAMEENSKIVYTQMGNSLKSVLDFTRATLKRNSNLETHLITNGGDLVRYDYSVQLLGEGGQAHLNGLWMLEGVKEAHIHVLMEHKAPHCQSLQLYKGVLDGASRSSFEGKIWVAKEAQKTDSFQLNNNLILSDTAQANSKPNLEIFADDVKASHGATVGQPDPDEIFYLTTRGFTKKEALGLLTGAFINELIQKVTHPPVLKEALELSSHYLKR